jgi:hypothetical protein
MYETEKNPNFLVTFATTAAGRAKKSSPSSASHNASTSRSCNHCSTATSAGPLALPRPCTPNCPCSARTEA